MACCALASRIVPFGTGGIGPWITPHNLRKAVAELARSEIAGEGYLS
jgi:hypothetical protein